MLINKLVNKLEFYHLCYLYIVFGRPLYYLVDVTSELILGRLGGGVQPFVFHNSKPLFFWQILGFEVIV